jgi:hypothetical protein
LRRWWLPSIRISETIIAERFASFKANAPADSTKQMPLRDLKMEPGAEELLSSPALEPYMNLALAVMGHKDVHPAIEEITALPPEKRYRWRVASALKWAFADFENLNVVADRRTRSQEDLDTLVDLLTVRPLQFCMFLAAFFGEEQMETINAGSVQQVKTLRANRWKSLGREPEMRED